MCTVSFFAREDGFLLGMNRDEKLARARALGAEILSRLSRHPRFISAALPRKIYPPKFNRYADGGTYGAHVDSAVMGLPGGLDSLRSDLSATVATAQTWVKATGTSATTWRWNS